MGGFWFYYGTLRWSGRGRVRAAAGAVHLAARDLVELAREVVR